MAAFRLQIAFHRCEVPDLKGAGRSLSARVSAVGTCTSVSSFAYSKTSCPVVVYRMHFGQTERLGITDSAAFCGQSLSLVSLFLDWGSREQQLQFVEASQARGPEAALREICGERHSLEVEQQFRAYLLAERLLAWSRQNVVAVTTTSAKSGATPD